MSTRAPVSREEATRICEQARKGIAATWERRCVRYAKNRERDWGTRLWRMLGWKTKTYDEFLQEGRDLLANGRIFGVDEFWSGSYWISKAEVAIRDIEALLKCSSGPIYLSASTLRDLEDYRDEA